MALVKEYLRKAKRKIRRLLCECGMAPVSPAVDVAVSNQDLSSRQTEAKILDYLSKQKSSGETTKIVFGGHWSNNPGWLLLNEADQDITKKLHCPNNSFDVVFLEHVLEHITFRDGFNFLEECFRILKPGGVVRIVCPMVDSLLKTVNTVKWDDPSSHIYYKDSLRPYFKDDSEYVQQKVGSDIFIGEAIPMFLHSMFKLHGHQFLWSRSLLVKALMGLGYSPVQEKSIGQSVSSEASIERRRRGLYHGHDWALELASTDVFDLESTVVEAVKPN